MIAFLRIRGHVFDSAIEKVVDDMVIVCVCLRLVRGSTVR
jgi:hypothetical protein